ncbi:MAG: response regulator [Desulfomonilaceae bacterium]|nr:response regulator [Desulfomonilaceae bacterium]
MVTKDIVDGKRILAVDDEPEILEIIQEALDHCVVVTASSFEEASKEIADHEFDLVILDIMGVRGFDLLKRCRDRKMPAAMLTAHAIDVESLNKSLRLGAVSFLPKEELVRLPELVTEIFESVEAGRSHWPQLFKRLGPFFKTRLGVVWEDLEKPTYPDHYY